MSFYTIQKNVDGYELFLENGVFDENGIVKAREILVAECKGKLQKRHDEYWKARNDYIDEIVTLQDVLEYKLEKYGDNFPSGAINRRIDELNNNMIFNNILLVKIITVNRKTCDLNLKSGYFDQLSKRN